MEGHLSSRLWTSNTHKDKSNCDVADHLFIIGTLQIPSCLGREEKRYQQAPAVDGRVGAGTEPCSPFLHPLSEQLCSPVSKVAFGSSVLCVFKTASSQPPNLMTSKFLNGRKRVGCVLGHVCGDLALVFALCLP